MLAEDENNIDQDAWTVVPTPSALMAPVLAEDQNPVGLDAWRGSRALVVHPSPDPIVDEPDSDLDDDGTGDLDDVGSAVQQAAQMGIHHGQTRAVRDANRALRIVKAKLAREVAGTRRCPGSRARGWCPYGGRLPSMVSQQRGVCHKCFRAESTFLHQDVQRARAEVAAARVRHQDEVAAARRQAQTAELRRRRNNVLATPCSVEARKSHSANRG